MSDPHTLTSWVLAATVEHELIRLEAHAGQSVTFAERPLNDAEKAAHTRFGDIEDIVEGNTEAGSPLIAGLYGAVIGGLLAAIFDDEDPEDDDGDVEAEDTVEAAALTALLLSLLSNPPRGLIREQDTAEANLRSLIDASYLGGVLTILDEAKRQGLDVKDWDRPVRPAALAILARDIAAHPWQRVVERALHEYQTPAHLLGPPIPRSQLIEFLESTSQAGTLDLLHQANQSALNVGRNDTAANYAGDFIAAYASEILDQNTCGPCATIDGTRFDTPEEARAAYPAGYVNCQGGSRCRGLVVYILDAAAVPED